MKHLNNGFTGRRFLLSAAAALAAGSGLAYGLATSAIGEAGTPSQLTQTISSGTGAFSKTVTRVVTISQPGIAGVNSLQAPPAEPAASIPPNTQVPVAPTILNYTNGWSVSDGPVEVSVYAGSDATSPSTGMLVVMTDDLGRQRVKMLRLAGAGALTITGATSGSDAATTDTGPNGQTVTVPSEAAPEAKAETGSLQFSRTDGGSGSLDLKTLATS